MLKTDGTKQLQEFADRICLPNQLKQISDRIYFASGYGHSNVIAVAGHTSLILIDTLDSPKRASVLRDELFEKTGKSVETIIYTHGHPDHRGGSAAFSATAKRIIASTSRRPALEGMEILSDILGLRTKRQFGYGLTSEELITQGLGIREGHATSSDDHYAVIPPNEWFCEETKEYVIDGIRLQLISAVGETDDQLYVWFPEEKVLCCGDNYYGCWPNLYAIRGSQFRDVAAWVHSLETILAYPVKNLLPGHMSDIDGAEKIRYVIGIYKDAIHSILIQTLTCMNEGLSESETVDRVKLPAEYSNIVFLGEFYGTVSWSVRSIYHGYFGWFDGNPTSLNRLSADIRSQKQTALMGGEKRVLEAAEDAYTANDFQWAAELCDQLILGTQLTGEAASLKVKCLLALGGMETSSNGRHYYISCAKELEAAGGAKKI